MYMLINPAHRPKIPTVSPPSTGIQRFRMSHNIAQEDHGCQLFFSRRWPSVPLRRRSLDDTSDHQVVYFAHNRRRVGPNAFSFLHHLLKGPLGFSAAGVAVELDDGPLIIYAKLSVLLTDGEGWRRL